MSDSEPSSEALGSISEAFLSAATRYDPSSAYVSPLPIEEVEAVGDWLAQRGYVLHAGSLRRQVKTLRDSFPLGFWSTVPPDGHERKRREEYRKTLGRIGRILEEAKSLSATPPAGPSVTVAEADTLARKLDARDPTFRAGTAEQQSDALLCDGPTPPDGFTWQGQTYRGMRTKVYLAVSFLWPRRHRSAHCKELGEPVWRDFVIEPDYTAVRGVCRDINRFFRTNGIPFHAEFKLDYLSLRDGAPRKPKAKPRATRARKKKGPSR
jgi:hypothetical protein